MNKYIILLRGINVSGKNKIPMADLRDLLKNLAFQNIQTYIQSGNIILESEKSKSEVCKLIKDGIKTKFGFEVPVIVKTVSEFKKAIKRYPFSTDNPKIVAFVFLNGKTSKTQIEIKNIGEDKYKIDDDIVYLICPSGFGKTKITNNVLEKKLEVIATTRNYKTTTKLLALATE